MSCSRVGVMIRLNRHWSIRSTAAMHTPSKTSRMAGKRFA